MSFKKDFEKLDLRFILKSLSIHSLNGDTIMIWAALILFFAYHTLPPLFHAYFWSITGLAIIGLTFEFLGTPVWFYGFFFDVVKFITFSNT